jgi:hypothetical protein
VRDADSGRARGDAQPEQHPAEEIATDRGVFLSYRRADTRDVVQGLSERLREDLGSSNVFGTRRISSAANHGSRSSRSRSRGSDAALFLIGSGWTGERPTAPPSLDAKAPR